MESAVGQTATESNGKTGWRKTTRTPGTSVFQRRPGATGQITMRPTTRRTIGATTSTAGKASAQDGSQAESQ